SSWIEIRRRRQNPFVIFEICERERCRTTSLSDELDALRLLVTACEAVFVTALKCRIAARILNFEPSQPQLSSSKPLRDVCVTERLLLNIGGLICGRSAKLPE